MKMEVEKIDTKLLKHRVNEIECKMKCILEKKNESKKAHETMIEKCKRSESKHDECAKDL